MKIRGMFAAYLLGVTALLAAVAAGSTWSWRESLRAQADQAAALAVTHLVQGLTAPLEQARQTLRLLAQSDELTPQVPARARAQLQRWNARPGVFEAFYLNALSGEVTPAEGPGFNVSDRPYFPALARGDEVVSAPVLSRASQIPVVVLSVPLHGGASRLDGALVGTLRVADILAGAPSDSPSQGAWRAVFDAQGQVIDSAGLARPGRLTPLAEAPPTLRALWDLVRTSAPARPGTASALHAELEGRRTRLHVARVPGLDWVVVHAQAEAEVLAPASRAMALAGLLMALLVACGWGGHLLLDRRLVRRIQSLIDAHRAWEAGRQDVAVHLDGQDELVALAEAFNRSVRSLSAAEQRFQAIFEAMPHPVVMTRVDDGVIIEVNAAFERMRQTPRGAVVGRTAEQLGHDPHKVTRERAELLATGELNEAAREVALPDGRRYWLQYNTRLAELNGERVAISAVADITQLKAAELALARSQQMLLALVQQAPVPMSYSPLEPDGRLLQTFWNGTWYATYGHAPGSKEGLPGSSFGLWAQPAVRDAYLAEVVAQGRVQAREARLVDAGGHERVCEVYGSLIDTGDRRIIMSTYIDVTQQRADALRLKEFQAMVENADDAMFFIDQGLITAINPACERLFGLSSAQIVGRGPAALSPPRQPDGRDSQQAARERIAQVLSGGPARFHWQHRRGDGSEFTAQVALSAVDGYPQRIIVVLRDVTEEQAATRALQRSEARFRSIIAVSNTGAWELDSDTGLRWCSPEYFTMLGYDPADFPMDGRAGIHEVWLDLLHPDDRERARQQFEAYLAQGSPGLYESEFRMRHADGSWVWIWSRGQTLRNPDGSVGNLTLGTHINVTDKRQAEQRLRDSQLRLETISNNLPGSMVYQLDCGADGTTRQFTYLSAGITRLHGLDRDAVLRDATLMYRQIHPDDLPVLAQLEVERMAAMAEFNTEYRGRGPAGDERWFLVASTPHRNADGHIIWDGIELDITERKRAQAAAETSRVQLTATLDNTPTVAVQWYDRDGRVLYWNPASESLYGLSAARMLGQLPIGTLYRDPAEFQVFLDLIRGIEASGRAVGPYEIDLNLRDGRCVSVLATTFAIPMGEGGQCFVCMDVDITERKRLESELRELAAQLEERVTRRTAALEARNAELRNAQDELVRSEKLASLGALVAGVSHELNTPIGNATMVASTLADRQREFEAGMADGLRRSALQGFLQDTREITDVLDRNLRRAAELIASFKQLAVDHTSDQRRQFDPADVVGEVLLALSPSLKRARVEPEVDAEPGLLLDSYPGPLGQVLMNLINNALVHAFTPDRPGRLWIGLHRRGEGLAVLTLRDNGKGIAADHLPRVFDPFFTTRLGQGGSGLGLHIVHNLVTSLLGGRISVTSRPGEGTVFEIELPLDAPLAPPASSA